MSEEGTGIESGASCAGWLFECQSVTAASAGPCTIHAGKTVGTEFPTSLLGPGHTGIGTVAVISEKLSPPLHCPCVGLGGAGGRATLQTQVGVKLQSS